MASPPGANWDGHNVKAKIHRSRKSKLQNRRRAGTQGSTVTEWCRKCFICLSFHHCCNATLLNLPRRGGVLSWVAKSEDIKLCSLPLLLLLKLLECTGNIPFLTFRAGEGETAARSAAQHKENSQESSSPPVPLVKNNLTPVTSPFPSHPTSSW